MRFHRGFVLLVVVGLLSAQDNALVPAAPRATAGETVVVSYGKPDTGSRRERMNAPVAKWTLTGAGTLSGPNPAQSIQYTAPSSVIPANVMEGCQVLPNDAVFNVPVDKLPADPNSTAKLNLVYANTTQPLSFQPSWGISTADSTTPTVDYRSYYDSVLHSGFPYPTGPHLSRENGAHVGTFSFGAAGNAGGTPDHHTLAVRKSDCNFFESYDNYISGYVRECRDGTPNCNVQSAVRYDSGTYAIQGGTDAAGLLLAPLTWHVDEVESGEIKHATRYTTNGMFLYNSFIWPASASAGGWSSCPLAACFHLGNRLRLRADFNTEAVCNSGIALQDKACSTMLTAIKRYGMILADTGTNNAIQVSDDFSRDPNVMNGMQAIAAAKLPVDPSTFDVVDESSLEVSPTSYQICPYEHACMGTTNSYVSVSDQAILTATPQHEQPISVPIAIQGTAIGLGVPTPLPIVTGNYSIQVPTWVTGSNNQSVKWTKISGAGFVTAGGVYTPPVNLSEGISAVLVATSEANAEATAAVHVTLLPSSSSGIARIDTGSPVSTTDDNGVVWAADPGIDGAMNNVPSDYPNWTTKNPARVIYESSDYSQHDLRLRIGVPNGNYLVHLLFGVAYNGCGSSCGARWTDNNRFNTFTFNPQLIETQGEIQNHYFDFGLLTGYAYATPVDLYVPAKVSDNILEIGVLPLAPDTGTNTAPMWGNKVNSLSGVEILPDTSAPKWAIDSQQQTSLAPGASLQLYVEDYYVGSTVARWSIVGGPGIVSNSGLLSLPPGSSTGANIVVKAVSVASPAVSATATICVNACSQTGANRAKASPPRGVWKSVERFVVFVFKKVREGLSRLA